MKNIISTDPMIVWPGTGGWPSAYVAERAVNEFTNDKITPDQLAQARERGLAPRHFSLSGIVGYERSELAQWVRVFLAVGTESIRDKMLELWVRERIAESDPAAGIAHKLLDRWLRGLPWIENDAIYVVHERNLYDLTGGLLTRGEFLQLEDERASMIDLYDAGEAAPMPKRYVLNGHVDCVVSCEVGAQFKGRIVNPDVVYDVRSVCGFVEDLVHHPNVESVSKECVYNNGEDDDRPF